MYTIKYVPDSGWPYEVYRNDDRIDYFTTLWGAKRCIKRKKKQEARVNEYNEGQIPDGD